FVQALIQVGIEITPEQVRDEIRYGIFPSVDNSSLILGYYNTSGSDNTDYSLVYVFDPNTEVFSSDNSLREMARALGVWFGNNDEAWSIEFNNKINNFGTIYIHNPFKELRLQPGNNVKLRNIYSMVEQTTRNGSNVMLGSIVPFTTEALNEISPRISGMTNEQVESLLRDHIRRVMEYKPEDSNKPPLKNLVDVWVLTNEVNPHFIAQGWNKNPLVEKLGWREFFRVVFETAQEIDPNALLVFDNYNNEYPQSLHPAGTQNQTLEILRYLKSIGIHNVGVGMQCHINLLGDHIISTQQQFESVIKNYRGNGAEVIITEMDVNISPKSYNGSRPFPYETRLKEQAGIYQSLIDGYLNQTKGQRYRIISFWGRRDNHSWIAPIMGIEDPAPLLFDKDGKSKPSWYAIQAVFLEHLQEAKNTAEN
ncbi:MAG: endo-1,4-beta-xylanase, partial [Methanothermobacter tenebrarum]